MPSQQRCAHHPRRVQAKTQPHLRYFLDKVVVAQTSPALNLRSISEHANDSVFVPVCVIVEGADGKAFSPNSRHRELPPEPVPVGISLDTIAKVHPRTAVELEDANSTLLGVGPERSTNCDNLSIVRQRDRSAELIQCTLSVNICTNLTPRSGVPSKHSDVAGVRLASPVAQG